MHNMLSLLNRLLNAANMSTEDRQKLNQRAQRFAKEQVGNKKYKNKISIKEMIQSVVGTMVYLIDWILYSNTRQMIQTPAGGVMPLREHARSWRSHTCG